jgi:hypothetical protein
MAGDNKRKVLGTLETLEDDDVRPPDSLLFPELAVERRDSKGYVSENKSLPMRCDLIGERQRDGRRGGEAVIWCSGESMWSGTPGGR